MQTMYFSQIEKCVKSFLCILRNVKVLIRDGTETDFTMCLDKNHSQ